MNDIMVNWGHISYWRFMGGASSIAKELKWSKDKAAKLWKQLDPCHTGFVYSTVIFQKVLPMVEQETHWDAKKAKYFVQARMNINETNLASGLAANGADPTPVVSADCPAPAPPAPKP
jgi:hypothetical protein